ncbi:MAG TPA: hypothetical protein VF529_00080 [Solirubrobacteraceae bacterium]|jgi:hypothetical protein
MSDQGPSLIHPTYRYLDRAVRLAGLTLAQWTQLVGAGAGAWLLARALPFSATYDLSVAIAIVGVPVAASLAAGADAVHPVAQLRAVLAWRRRAAVYLPGAATTADGFRLVVELPRVAATGVPISSVEDLWD